MLSNSIQKAENLVDNIPLTVEIIKGVEGLAVYINEYRICGSKPWGGGSSLGQWKIKFGDLPKEIKDTLPTQITLAVKEALEEIKLEKKDKTDATPFSDHSFETGKYHGYNQAVSEQSTLIEKYLE